MEQNNETPKIEFQEEESEQSSQYLQTKTPKIILWVIKYSGGYIKDKKQANYVLIGFVVVAVGISLFLIFGGGETRVPIEDMIFSETPS